MNDKTVIFEVSLTVDGELAGEFEWYMTSKHIPEVIATGCFRDAWFGRDGLEYRVCYRTTRDEFEKYLGSHASALREDFAEHFPTGVQLTRRNWDVIGSF